MIVPDTASATDPEQMLLQLVGVVADSLSTEFSDDYDRRSDDSMVDFAERELGLKLRGSPSLHSIYVDAVQRMRRREAIRLAVVGPRGGGKTKLASAVQLTAWKFFGYDVSNVGGSLRQAQRCYEYVLEAFGFSETVRRHFVRVPTMSRSRSVDGREMFINAASQTSVRGPHPGGETHGGMLIVDEGAIIDDSIIKAAMFQVSAANPSAVIQLSTMGEAEDGYWQDMVRDPQHKGFDLRSFDCFDVAARCKYDCATTCPNKEHFADDYYRGTGETRELVHKALCGGKAHATDGHLQVDEIANSFRDTDTETFLREMMGVKASSVGKVFDAGLVDAAVCDSVDLSMDPAQAEKRFLALDKVIGLDWGWAGMTAAVYCVRLRDVLVVYRWEMWDHVAFQKIRGHVLGTCFAERIDTICPDGAEPSENHQMQEDADRLSTVDPKPLARAPDDSSPDDFSIRVAPVTFSQWKRWGYGAARRRFETDKVLFPRSFNGRPVEGLDRATALVKAHHRSAKDGQPEKRDDHVSDALVCAVLGFDPTFVAKSRSP